MIKFAIGKTRENQWRTRGGGLRTMGKHIPEAHTPEKHQL